MTAGLPVLYVTGWCRSGTTLIGNLLGELDGVLHVGELHYLWVNGVLRQGTNSTCGCGTDIAACALWSAVLARVTRGDPGYAGQAIRDQRAWLRTRHTSARLAESAGRRPMAPSPRAALARLECLYEAIADTSGARVVVDTGKFPAEAAALCGSSRVDARILHVVRDPRATAESWRRPKAYIPRMGPLRSTGYWVGFNLASDRIGRAFPGRYLRLGYETFTARPREALAAVLGFAGIDQTPPVTADGRAALGVNHTVTGNPDRLRQGPVQVRPDDAWQWAQPLRHRLLATTVAGPFLGRYGYRVAGTAGPAPVFNGRATSRWNPSGSAPTRR